MKNDEQKIQNLSINPKNYRSQKLKWQNLSQFLRNKIDKHANTTIDNKIKGLVSSEKSHNSTSHYKSSPSNPSIKVNKKSKNKQPKQVKGYYIKPSILSNFSLKLNKPGEGNYENSYASLLK